MESIRVFFRGSNEGETAMISTRGETLESLELGPVFMLCRRDQMKLNCYTVDGKDRWCILCQDWFA